jgi:hypothetical protein
VGKTNKPNDNIQNIFEYLIVFENGIFYVCSFLLLPLLLFRFCKIKKNGKKKCICFVSDVLFFTLADFLINEQFIHVSICGIFFYFASGGQLYMWGWNANGQVGDGTTTFRSFPTLISVGGTSVASVSLGDGHSSAVTTSMCLYYLLCFFF